MTQDPDLPSTTSVLLMEDNPGDARLIQELLHEGGGNWNVTHMDRLAAVRENVPEPSPDVILLDLGLPDSQGLETLHGINTILPASVVVVLTGLHDEAIGVTALQEGAQDYLVKDEVDGRLLVKAIRYAIERQRLLNQLAEIKGQQRESSLWGTLSHPPGTSVTAGMYGSMPLRDADRDIFASLVESYNALLQTAMEAQIYKKAGVPQETLKDIADKLGFLRASPRDVVDIHAEALRVRTIGISPVRKELYAVEGRLLVLELMGYLASYYRSYYLQRGKANYGEVK